MGKTMISEEDFSRMCGYLGVSVEDIRRKNRRRDMVYRRVVLCNYMYDLGMVYDDIAMYFGGMDHSSVMHYRKVYSNEIGLNTELRYFDEQLMRGINGVELN